MSNPVILKFFQFCDQSINVLIVYLTLIIILVLMEMFVRYITFRAYINTNQRFEND